MNWLIRALSLVILLLASGECNAQFNRTKNWVIGIGGLIDFNTDPPTIGTSALESFEGYSVISDTDGNLLFYTNGIKVWNANHEVMPNGLGLNSHLSATDAALIVPKPSTDHIYYIFTVGAYGGNQGGFGGIAYSVVDMSLIGGLGNVAQKNVVLHDKSTEKLCATRHENGVDYWIMTHDFGSDQFRAFLLAENGVIPEPVISKVGSVHIEWPENDWGSHATGSMRFSPSGCKLALVLSSQTDTIQVFQFDNATGYVFDLITLRALVQSRMPYSLCFSPNGNLLYVTGGKRVWQFNLSHPTEAAIQQSRTTIASHDIQISGTPKYNFTGLQIGPDGKIYISRILTDYLSSINLPDNPGAACQFQEVAVTFPSELCRYGLPNFVSNFLLPDTVAYDRCSDYCPPFSLGGDQTICEGESLLVSIDAPQGIVSWNDGSSDFEIVFTEEGQYTAEYVFNKCPALHDTMFVIVTKNFLPAIPDTVVCLDEPYIYVLPYDPNVVYNWSNGYTGAAFLTSTEGSFSIEVTKDNCVFAESFFVEDYCEPEEITHSMVLPNIFTPNGDGINDHFQPLQAENILSIDISVFNRWGKEVYRSFGPTFSWDGFQNGVKSSSGVYMYVIRYTALGGKEYLRQGTITIAD